MKHSRAIAGLLASLFAPPGHAQELAPSGRLGAVMEYDPARAPATTVYRPRDMAGATAMPIVAWGNGGCRATGGADNRPFLLELASHGYVVIALGKPGPDPVIQSTPRAVRPTSPMRP